MLESPLKKLQIINYLIIALIFLSVLLFTKDIISFALLKKEVPSSKSGDKTSAHITPAIENIMSYAPIVEKNPFGAPMKFHPIATGQPIKSAQDSLSELILIGTATGPKNLSYAVFMDKSKRAPHKQEVFAFGEEVYDFGALTKIEERFVELTKGTDTHTIHLIDILELRAKKHGSIAASGSQNRFVKKINEKKYLIDQRKVLQSLDNPKHILSDARLYPNIVDGKQDGFRITEVKPGGLYDSLGLRNRDILLRINGLELSTPEAAVQAMSALKGMETVNLDIIRNGKNITMGYQIE